MQPRGGAPARARQAHGQPSPTRCGAATTSRASTRAGAAPAGHTPCAASCVAIVSRQLASRFGCVVDPARRTVRRPDDTRCGATGVIAQRVFATGGSRPVVAPSARAAGPGVAAAGSGSGRRRGAAARSTGPVAVLREPAPAPSAPDPHGGRCRRRSRGRRRRRTRRSSSARGHRVVDAQLRPPSARRSRARRRTAAAARPSNVPLSRVPLAVPDIASRRAVAESTYRSPS